MDNVPRVWSNTERVKEELNREGVVRKGVKEEKKEEEGRKSKRSMEECQ